MKIKELISEGYKLRKADYRDVLRYANNIILGVEYEFHPDTGLLEDEIDFDAAYDAAVEELYQRHDQWVKEIIDEEVREVEWKYEELVNSVEINSKEIEKLANELEVKLNDFEDETDVDDEDYENEYETFLRELEETFVNRFNNIKYNLEENVREYNDLSYTNVLGFDDGDITVVISAIGDLISSIEEEDELEDLKKVTNELYLEANSLYSDSYYNDTELKSSISDSYEYEYEYEYWLNNIEGTSIEDYVIEYASENGITKSNIDSAIEEIKEDLSDIKEIDDVVEENETTAEIITKPVPLPVQFEIMEEIHEYIQDNGTTSYDTGQHVNMSFRNVHDYSQFNFVKLVILGGLEYLTTEKKYNDRNHVRVLYSIFEQHIRTIARAYNRNGLKEVEYVMENILNEKKNQVVSITQLFFENVDDRRIELRYFGGEDYEYKTEEIQDDILKAAHGFLIALDPQYERRRYIKDLFRFLDNMVQTFYRNNDELRNMTFIEYAQYIKLNK